jgi:hypothetical protein
MDHLEMRRIAAIAFVSSLGLTACGGSVPCAGVEADGVCWVGRDGLTVSQVRAGHVLEIARRYWEQGSAPEGWTVEFGREPIVHVDHDVGGASVTHVVDGIGYFGWACPQHRLILVQPFAGADCIERSVIFHELGHAWGVPEGDARLYGEYDLMRQAMEASGWSGCLDLVTDER